MNRNIIISLGIIAILAGYIVYKGVKKSTGVPELKEWKESADEITVKKGGKSIFFKNKEGKWLINEEAYPADTLLVQNIENSVKKMQLTDLISSQGFYDKYDLTPENAGYISISREGKKLREVFIGKKGSTNRHTYVKVDNRPEIYLAAETFESFLDKTSDELRDRKIMDIKKEAVNSFEIKYRGITYNFNKIAEEKKPDKEEAADKKIKDKNGDKKDVKPEKTEKWICKGYPQAGLSTENINSLLSVIGPLTASDYPRVDKKTLSNPQCTVKFKAYDKDIIIEIFNREKDNKYISTSSESPYVYTIDEWRAKKFFLENIENLKEKK